MFNHDQYLDYLVTEREKAEDLAHEIIQYVEMIGTKQVIEDMELGDVIFSKLCENYPEKKCELIEHVITRVLGFAMIDDLVTLELTTYQDIIDHYHEEYLESITPND